MAVLYSDTGVPIRSTNALPVILYDVSGNPIASAARLAADGLSLPTAPDVLSASLLYNGATLDLQRGNTRATALASAARTATTSTADLINHNAKGVLIFFEISAVPGVDTVQLLVKCIDPVTGGVRTLANDSAVSAIGSRQMLVYPGAGTETNLEKISGVPLPRAWRIEIMHSGVGSFTYSVGYELIT